MLDGCSTEELELACLDTISAVNKRHELGILFFEQLSNRCPCCKTKLRTKARTSISRQNVINRSGGN